MFSRPDRRLPEQRGKGREEIGGVKEYLFGFVLASLNLLGLNLAQTLALKVTTSFFIQSKADPLETQLLLPAWAGSMGQALAVEAFALGLTLTLFLLTSQR